MSDQDEHERLEQGPNTPEADVAEEARVARDEGGEPPEDGPHQRAQKKQGSAKNG